MRRSSPPPSPEREQVVQLADQIVASWQQIHRICMSDTDWSKGLFQGALVFEDSSLLYKALAELLESIGEVPSWRKPKQ